MFLFLSFFPLRPSAESPGFYLDSLFAASCPEVIYTNWLPQQKKNPLCLFMHLCPTIRATLTTEKGTTVVHGSSLMALKLQCFP